MLNYVAYSILLNKNVLRKFFIFFLIFLKNIVKAGAVISQKKKILKALL